MRLIDADALRAKLTDYKTILADPNADISSMTVAAKMVEEAPTVDAVEVVRCRECKWLSMTTLGMEYACWKGAFSVWGETGQHYDHHVCRAVPNGDWYCADGER